MRPDMAKVIVERPRFGSRTRGAAKGYLRALHRLNDDGPPAREGMKRRHRGGTKFLNEHLGPLRRYLDAQVGRPWDLVFSEICAGIDRNSAVQDHVRDHVADYVIIHVILIDGIACSGEGGSRYGRPLHELYWQRWYVCPRTGLLRRVPARVRRPRIGPDVEPPPRFVRVDASLQCRRIGGAWHLVELKPLPPPRPRAQSRERDVMLDLPVAEQTPEQARKVYGAEVYAVAMRRLTRRELRQFPIPIELWD